MAIQERTIQIALKPGEVMMIQRKIYNISEMLLIFMLSVVLTTVFFLLCGVSVGYINLLFPVILMFYFRYRFLGPKEHFIQDCVVSLMILALFVVISGSVYDNTWDGAAYHKTAVGLLKEGWNPFYMSADYFNSIAHSIEPAQHNPLLWAEAYPKATWYFASTVYYLIGNIECGKCYTLIFAFITFGICLEYFIKKIGTKRAYFLALTAALNPIVCAQFQTYYLDGCVACILTMLIIKFLELLEGVSNSELLQKHISVFALIVWGCNLKFNIALYIATICAIYCICISIKSRKVQIKSILMLVMEGIISICVVGAAPYITNLTRYGTIFYGFIGLLDETMFQETFGIMGLNRTGRFWVSVFGRTSHGQYSRLRDVLKIPFTFNKYELEYYFIPDARVGAFGIMFSGLFLAATIVLIIILIKKLRNKEYSVPYIYTFLLWITSIIEFCIIPQTSQFRYIPHLYLVIVYALYYLLKNCNTGLRKLILGLYMTLIVFNIMPWGKVSLQKLRNGVGTRTTLEYLGDTCKAGEQTYQIAFYRNDFTGMVYNLKDFGIKYEYINIADIDQDYKVTYSDWLYYKGLYD